MCNELSSIDTPKMGVSAVTKGRSATFVIRDNVHEKGPQVQKTRSTVATAAATLTARPSNARQAKKTTTKPGISISINIFICVSLFV